MRSLHRYASDVMVLTMVLHLLRHFTFDHYRAFRWFSRGSRGVVVLWLVYASGINGYMLPWDKYAQFVVVATMEWFDWLPVFNGTLIRNFVFPKASTIGCSRCSRSCTSASRSAVLVLLWVHTQRVPRARTNPPRPIAHDRCTVTLIVLSLVKPAVSQGPADLSRRSPQRSTSTGSTCRSIR